jgi:3-hydroxyisobutyrate dehydrogenase-like beta-hydroxyacid dehydrogenase
MKAGFIGLGNMGQAMGRNLIKAGHELLVYNRTRRRAEELACEGAVVTDSPAEACSPGVVMTMLADDGAVEDMVFGNDGILSALPEGGIHVSFSTIGVALARRLAESHRKRGQDFVASPVFGRPQAAEAAKLLVVTAGPGGAVERCRPLFEAVGDRLFVLGSEAAAANALKLGGNFLIASMVEAFGEAIALMRKSGVDPAQFLQIVNGSLFKSPVYENYGKIVLEERFQPPGFKMSLGLKDLRLVLAAGEAVNVPLPLASLIRDHLISGIARGFGEHDWSAVAKVAAADAGL